MKNFEAMEVLPLRGMDGFDLLKAFPGPDDVLCQIWWLWCNITQGRIVD